MTSRTCARFLASVAASLVAAGSALAADYHVSPQGRDADPGRKAQPFRTLAKVCSVAGPGDTVYLRAGTYREVLKPQRSGEPGKPLRFLAMPGEKVVLSGADALTGTWQRHQGSIYKLATMRKFAQLFGDSQMMPEARRRQARGVSGASFHRPAAHRRGPGQAHGFRRVGE